MCQGKPHHRLPPSARIQREVHGTLGALRLGLGHDQVDGVLRQVLHRHAALVLDVLEIDGDAAQAEHQRVLEQAGDDAEAVVLAHQDVGT